MNDLIENLVNILEYKNDNLVKSPNEYYDYYYCLNYSDEKSKSKTFYKIVGIKSFDTVDEDEINRYHRIYWNKNDIPISILVFRDEIRVYNNFTYDNEKALLFSSKQKNNKNFQLDYLKNTSIRSNLFWDKFNSIIRKSERVDINLLNNLETTIKKISMKSSCDKEDAFDFITKCILVKYLEDRKVLVDNTFTRFQSDDFTDLLAKKDYNLILSFFNYLKKRFNSEFFCVEKNTIFQSDSAVNQIVDFFKGNDIESGQLSFFPYDFSIIPIELISSIYEKFFNIAAIGEEKQKVRKETGSFYTPYFLANFIVDREILLTKENYSKIRILDPACGSGVFLVSAFKKIVEFYKSNNIDIDSTVLNNIIVNQIYGVDKNTQALKITEFSLYIALLDCMDPKDLEINNFEFPILVNRTLHGVSFFSDECLVGKEKFDIILGNPPWKSILGDHVNYCQKRKFLLSDNQLAQAFIYRANDFLSENGHICFILPNSIFFNTNAECVRKQILELNSVEEILNLSSISNNLFADAAFPCSIVRLNRLGNNKNVCIVNFTPNVFSRILNKIVLDFNNAVSVEISLLKKYDYLWNIVMNGDYYDFLLIQKIKTKNYNIIDLCNAYKLVHTQGYTKGQQTKKYDCYNGYEILEDELVHSYIFRKRLKKHVGVLGVERIHDKNQYHKHNKVIFRRTLKTNSKTNYAAFYDDRLLYNNKYYCIYDPADCVDKDVFYYLESILNSKIYAYYQFHMSTAYKLNPPEVRKDKALEFPITIYNSDSTIVKQIVSNARKIDALYSKIEELKMQLFYDTSDYENEILSLEEKNDCLFFDLYGLDDKDIATIYYTLDCRIPIVRNKKMGKATESELRNYCQVIKQYFDELLDETCQKLICRVYMSSTIITVKFKFSEDDSRAIVFTDDNASIPLNMVSNQLLVTKKIKLFDNNDDSFSIVKTSDMFNWREHNAFVDFQEFIKAAFVSKEGE